MYMAENCLEMVVKWPFLSVSNFGDQSLELVIPKVNHRMSRHRNFFAKLCAMYKRERCTMNTQTLNFLKFALRHKASHIEMWYN